MSHRKPFKPAGAVPILPVSPGPPQESQYKYAAAIDFGTTRSAVAYCVIDESERQIGRNRQFEIYTAQAETNPSDDASSRLASKTPTLLILFDPPRADQAAQGVEIGINSFTYHMDEQTDNAFVCRDFKMLLDVVDRRTREQHVDLHKTMVELHSISDSSKTITRPLLEVVSKYLHEAAQCALNNLQSHLEDRGHNANIPKTLGELHWTITIPAIWTDQARIFMRRAAQKAGLVADEELFTSRVSLCLEPEGAALESFVSLGLKEDREVMQKMKGKTFLMIDLGGGTADITIQTLSTFNILSDIIGFEEYAPPTGGPWGGRLLNKVFLDKVLKPLSPPGKWNKGYEDNTAKQIMYEWEIFDPVKREFPSNAPRSRRGPVASMPTANIYVSVPFTVDVCRLHVVNSGLASNQHIEVATNTGTYAKLKLPAAFVQNVLFASVTTPLLSHLDTVLAQHKPEMAFLVGGMGANKHIVDVIGKYCKRKNVHFFSSQSINASESIVRGAVRYSIDRQVFGIRKSRTNYGIKLHNAEDPSNPRFQRLVKKGESLSELQKRTKAHPLGPYSPVKESHTSVTFAVYETSTDADKGFISDDGMYSIVEVVVPLDMSIPYEDRSFEIELEVNQHILSGWIIPLGGGEKHHIQWSSR
eukprot:m.10354 g.10354  ORF g.10354 m.10354 type:complete len:645 (-) comp7343_c0_seq1:521-2455(-)